MTFIIAEAGVNHNGSIENALKLIDVAKKAGASAVKFQIFFSENLTTEKAQLANYQKKNQKIKKNQRELLKSLELKKSDYRKLQSYAKKVKIEFLITPFGIEELKFVQEDLKLLNIKISSGEITNGPFLELASSKSNLLILSTGMSNFDEIDQALNIIYNGSKNRDKFLKLSDINSLSKPKVVLLHCTSDYPTNLKNVNLKAMIKMQQRYNLDIGYSDHTLDSITAICAVANGAKVIEKHITLSKNQIGPDHLASMEPESFKQFVNQIKSVEVLMGSSQKKSTKNENITKALVRKSIVAKKKIIKGDIFNFNNLTVKRPANGMSPMKLWDLIGKKANRKFDKDELIET